MRSRLTLHSNPSTNDFNFDFNRGGFDHSFSRPDLSGDALLHIPAQAIYAATAPVGSAAANRRKAGMRKQMAIRQLQESGLLVAGPQAIEVDYDSEQPALIQRGTGGKVFFPALPGPNHEVLAEQARESCLTKMTELDDHLSEMRRKLYNESAIVLQHFIEYCVLRCRRYRWWQKHHRAASKIQTRKRIMDARVELDFRKNKAARKLEATILIQTRQRIRIANAEKDRRFQIMIWVQRCARRFLAALELNKRKKERARNLAAKKIQAPARGVLARRQYHVIMSALRIQQRYRMSKAKTRVQDLSSARKIQSIIRARRAFRRYKIYKLAMRIQSAWRMYWLQKHWKIYKAAQAIQCAWRHHHWRTWWIMGKSASSNL